MLTYADIESYIADGKTDAEIAFILEADPRTVRDIPIAVLRQYALIEWQLVYPAPGTGAPAGPLVDLHNGLVAQDRPEAAASVWRLICQILFNTSAEAVLTASRADYATLWHELAPSILTHPEMVAAMEAVHGGRRFAGVTEADVAECRRMHDLTTRLQAAYEAGVVERDNGGDAAAVKAAIDDAWGA